MVGAMDAPLPVAARTGRFGVYLHYPYCRRRCPYCDFNVVALQGNPHRAYRDAVIAELAVRAPSFAGRGPAVSLYLGGGTPGLWPAEHLAAVIEAVDRTLGLADEAEITLECNPEDVTLGHLRAARAAGVNRLSLGLQSLNDATLTALGRTHDAAAGRAAFARARMAGFDAISVDLIFGLAGQPLDALLADAADLVALGPEHLSAYQLTIEEGTSFGARARRGEVLDAPEDTQLAMFESLSEQLDAAGLRPYEVSNFARPGQESRHNLLYWQGDEYLALGAGAHGFLRTGEGGTRWENARSPTAYLAGATRGVPAEAWREDADAATVQEERVLCGLRLWGGLVPDEPLRARFGTGAAAMAARGLLDLCEERWTPTTRGRALLNALIAGVVGG
jgi:oxygen-independent coproporphyrinogen III oxidase